METILQEMEEASQFIASRVKLKPGVGIILGTGLGGLAEKISLRQSLPYEEIPHFPRSTVEGHAGRLIFGRCSNKEVLVMQGRFHFYEGYSLSRVTFPVRVMKKLGVKILIISNAAGGLNPLFSAGDVMVISDHINFTGQNPLIGPNFDALGPRFPDMTAVYDRELIGLSEQVALEKKIKLQKGVYVGVTGPSMETPAETRFLRMMGADAVGMSTIPEVIVGVHCGLRILGFSAISNVNLPDCMQPAPLEAILANAALAGKKMIGIVEGSFGKNLEEVSLGQQVKKTADLILTNGTVLPLSPDSEPIIDGALAVSNGRITGLGAKAQVERYFEARQTIDAGGGLIMPGLVNAHNHAAMTCYRGMADDLPLMEWLTHYIFPAESKSDGDQVYWCTLLACAEMIRSGTTTFCDMYLFEDRVAQAAKEAGMRALVGEVLYDFSSPNYGPLEKGLEFTESLINAGRKIP